MITRVPFQSKWFSDFLGHTQLPITSYRVTLGTSDG